MDALPPELFFSILQRLPVKMLLRFRAVCKLWCDTIDDPALAIAQLSVAVEEPMLIGISRPLEEIKCSHIVEETGSKGRKSLLIRIRNEAIARFRMVRLSSLVNSCNGLLCFSNRGCDYHYTHEGVIANIFVCNPLMQEVRVVPPLPPKQMLGLGFSPSTQAFKVVGVAENFKCLEAKVCTLGFGTKVWRLISSAPPYPIYGKPAYADGALYWKIDDQCKTPNGERIVYFDVGEEEFGIADHPRELGSDNNEHIDLTELKGHLAVVDHSFHTHVDIWMLKGHGEKQWTRECRIAMNLRGGTYCKVIGQWRHHEIFLSINENENEFAYHSYDPKTDEMRSVRVSSHSQKRSIITDIFGHTWSMMSVKWL